MKKIVLYATLIYCVATNLYSNSARMQPVNSIVGDISFVHKFGNAPNSSTSEQLRIRTHLEYIENLLRKANTNHLSTSQKLKRAYLLDRLHDYWVDGLFPTNLAYPNERRPCFIDGFGAFCAVGHLIKLDAGFDLAEYINSKYQYANIYQMKSVELEEWVKQSGFTLQECAMIQPGYTIDQPDNLFVINSITPSSTVATKQFFNIVMDVDGIPTTATTNVSLSGRLVYTRPPPTIPFFNEQEIYLNLISTNLSSSVLKPGRTKGILTFRVNGSDIKVAENRAFVYFSSNEVTGNIITYRNVYYNAKPAIFSVSTATSVQLDRNNTEGDFFPNPINDLLNINIPLKPNTRIKVVTVQGHTIFNDVIKQFTNSFQIDCSQFVRGSYFIEVSNDEKRILKQIIKI
jgi:Secretion system C-terminal sorting domain